jgi:3-deoxy-D-manno-octulosonic-acid transferase
VSLAGRAWALGAGLVAPLLGLHFRRRIRIGKEIAERLEERRGGGASRRPGRLFWLHAASVGETISALPVLEAMAAREPALRFLFTTGTVTGAEMLARRLPPALAARVDHRFMPLDVPSWVARFLEEWRPDAAAFVESELWPNLLAAARARGLPMALVNGRMSARSFTRWKRAPGLAGEAMAAFRLVLARSEGDRGRFAALGAGAALCWGDLKAAAPPLPAEPTALARLRAMVGARPVWLAASTHPGEEAMVVAAHRALLARFPDLLAVIVPRHPERGEAVAAEAARIMSAEAARIMSAEAARIMSAEAEALLPGAVARRTAGGAPGAGVSVYVADTLGELGLFYRLARVTLVGGSLVPHGGQNPLEAARLRCPILFGPHMQNFEEAVDRLLAAGGAIRVEGATLADTVACVLSDEARRAALVAAAAGVADAHAGLPGRVAEALAGLLPPA